MPTKKIINFALFQFGWFICVLVQNYYYLPLVFTVVAILIHERFIVSDRREWIVVLIVVLIGVSVDSIFGAAGILVFSQSFVIPIWLICIWVLFSMTLCHSLSWLQDRFLLAGVLSSVAGPLSYVAGSRLSGGTVDIGHPLALSLVLISMFWLTIVPVSLFLMKKIFK